MNALKIAAIGVAVLVISAGAVVATPGNAPDGTPAGENADGQTNNSDQTDAPANETDAGNADHGAEVGDRGPPTSLPDPVPDFVGNIHDTIRGFIDGTIDNLGHAISDIAGGENADDDSDEAMNTTTTANETTTTA